MTSSSPKTPDVQSLDALTGGAFVAQTSGERAAKLREWLLTDPSQDMLQLVYKELSNRDKGAAKVLRERLDELKRSHGQDVLAAEWAARAQTMLSADRINIADAMAWQRDAAKAGAPLSREPLAGLKLQLNEKIKVLEDLQHQVMVQRETAVLLAQRIEVLSTKSLKEADLANDMLQADVAHWQQQAQSLTGNPNWQSVDLKYPPQLETSRQQLLSVWEAFEGALFQAKSARDDANEPLPPVPVWAEEIRLARGGSVYVAPSHAAHSQRPTPAELNAARTASEKADGHHASVTPAPSDSAMSGEQSGVGSGLHQADAGQVEKPAKPVKTSITKMDPAQRLALREAANEVVRGALAVLAAENNEANLASLLQVLKDHGKNMDTAMDLQVHEALVAAGHAAGWQRHVADQSRLALVLKAEALFKKVPVKLEKLAEPSAPEVTLEVTTEAAPEAPTEVITEITTEVTSDVTTEATTEVKDEIKTELKEEAPTEAKVQAPKVLVAENFVLEPAVGGRKMQEALRQLREDWKQADQGGLPNHALWKRFDAACNNAYKVVQTWLDKIKHEAAEHRAQRLALIDEVKQWGEANANNSDWRAHLRTLHQFGDRWRNAGHLSEKAFAELQPLWKQALQTAAAPLEAAQKASTDRRQALIEQAEQLGAAPVLRVDAVKALQQSWQAEAQSVPMDRRFEQKMWEAFRKPIDDAFNRKTSAREPQSSAPLSAHDRLVLDASNALKAANASGDVQQIKSAMAALDAALKGQATAVASGSVVQTKNAPSTPLVSESNSASSALTDEAASVEPTDANAPMAAEPSDDSSSDSANEPVVETSQEPAKPAPKPARPLVAMRGDDRPGQVKSVPAPAGRGGPGDRRDGKGGGQGGKPGRFDRDDRSERQDRGPRLGDAAFRAQRDAMEHAELALRKLAAQAHGESLTQLLSAWEKRQPDLMPTSQALGRNVNAAARAAWTHAVQQAPASTATEAILRLEMAAEVPTPAENLNERRALQLQLLTRKNQPGPAETWGLDVTAVLSTSHDDKLARRLQSALKNLLRN